MTPPVPRPDQAARERALLDAITAAGPDGITARELHEKTADMWASRTSLYVRLEDLVRRRLIYQGHHRGPYTLPINAVPQ